MRNVKAIPLLFSYGCNGLEVGYFIFSVGNNDLFSVVEMTVLNRGTIPQVLNIQGEKSATLGPVL